ncbi:MAG TPA: LysR family transcriptional regulator [Steroidobacteraceae bacterium]|jgi:DNA-binding transcriptional LysR family regulator|nr:LysR family transcriptional regulator [Steroidobacteraceae bacterium]
MKHVTLRQLRVFLAAAHHMNFSRAAEELHLTQPAVSTQIKELAGSVGLPLFERIGRRTYLTPAGEEMLQCARAISQRLRESEEALARLKGITGGRLNVAVISAGDYFFPRLLAAFGASHPGITFNLTVHNREGLLHHLAENLTDLAVMVRPPGDLDIVALPFAPHPYVIVAPPEHPLARARQIPRSALTRERFVLREHGSDTWNSMREVFGRQFPRLNIAMQIQSTETIKQAVVAGMGLAFLSAHTLALDVRAGNLVVLDVQGFPAMLSWYLVHNRAKRLAPVAAAFKEFLLSDGAALIERLMPADFSPARAERETPDVRAAKRAKRPE